MVYLHDVLGYDICDVAARVGTSVSAAQSRLVRGRRELLGSVEDRPTPAPARPSLTPLAACNGVGGACGGLKTH